MLHKKRYVLISSLLFLWLSGCSTLQDKPELTTEVPGLYTLEKSDNPCKKEQSTPPNLGYSINDLSSALDALLQRSGDSDPVIIYVHGRAAGKSKEPGKSLRSIMPCLENEINARVMMFYWPGSGKGGLPGFPEPEARQAGQAFGQVVAEFKKYKEANSGHFQNRKAVLLMHSMGNLVFEEFIDKYQSEPFKNDLFDTVILSSPANATKDHAEWLKKALFSENIYVMVNENDMVLTLGGMGQMKGRLGKKLHTMFAGDVALANNVIYVNLDKSGIKGHRYFIGKGQESNPDVENFFEAVLTGQSINLDGFSGVKNIESRDGAKIYFFEKD